MGAELLVIGGGPAGLATAIAAAQSGFSVEVAEPQPGTIDKCCGEGLLPPAVRALGSLGITEQELAAVGSPLHGIHFHHEGREAAARFGTAGFGVRRTALHRLLRQRALAAGVCLTPRSARLLGQDGQVLVGDRVRTPGWVIGADGAQSATRRTAGLGECSIVLERMALRQHFLLLPRSAITAEVEVYWAQGSQAYLTPAGLGRVGVAVLAEGKIRSMEAALEQFPGLKQRLGPSCSALRGAVSYHRTLRKVHGGNVALVGDASGSVDAVTGDGLSLAFGQALALTDALRCGDLGRYGRAHTRLMLPARAMSRALLAMGNRPVITRASMMLLSRVPGLFPGLLHLHTHIPGSVSSHQEVLPWQAAPTSTRSTT